jgi:ABC-type methionine transport system ATPase subunit
MAERLPRRLSGGEQQRVSVARAFVNRPLIVLADEPTGNLDPATSVGIMRILDRINRTGTTVVMATHDHAIVDAMRRRVVQLERGRVVRDESRGVYETTLPEDDDAPDAPVVIADVAGHSNSSTAAEDTAKATLDVEEATVTASSAEEPAAAEETAVGEEEAVQDTEQNEQVVAADLEAPDEEPEADQEVDG